MFRSTVQVDHQKALMRLLVNKTAQPSNRITVINGIITGVGLEDMLDYSYSGVDQSGYLGLGFNLRVYSLFANFSPSTPFQAPL